MSVWLDMLSEIGDAALATFGEPAIPSSGEPLIGIFAESGEAPALWSEVGLDVRLSEQESPRLIMQASAAAALAPEDELTIRGHLYSVTRLRTRPEMPSLTEVELMPAEGPL